MQTPHQTVPSRKQNFWTKFEIVRITFLTKMIIIPRAGIFQDPRWKSRYPRFWSIFQKLSDPTSWKIHEGHKNLKGNEQKVCQNHVQNSKSLMMHHEIEIFDPCFFHFMRGNETFQRIFMKNLNSCPTNRFSLDSNPKWKIFFRWWNETSWKTLTFY